MSIESVLSNLELLLISAIPAAVKSAKFTEPVYCLRIYYDSIDTPEEGYVTRMRLLRVSARKNALATKGRNAPASIWLADETDGDEQGINIDLGENSKAIWLF
jgi:hypothetical protein